MLKMSKLPFTLSKVQLTQALSPALLDCHCCSWFLQSCLRLLLSSRYLTTNKLWCMMVIIGSLLVRQYYLAAACYMSTTIFSTSFMRGICSSTIKWLLVLTVMRLWDNYGLLSLIWRVVLLMFFLIYYFWHSCCL